MHCITLFEMFLREICFRCRIYAICLLAAVLLCPHMPANIRKLCFRQVGM